MPAASKFCPSCGQQQDAVQAAEAPQGMAANPRPKPYDQLTPDEKRDILYNNAARFLRLDTSEKK